MRHVDDSVKDSILRKFYKFYKELEALKKSADYSQKENLKGLQIKLMELIEQYTLNIQPYEKEENDSIYNETLYLLTIFTDEMFISTQWKGEYIWEDYLIEEQLFRSHYSGIKLYEMAESNLTKTTQAAQEMSVLYLLVLSLGFRGKFMFDDRDKKLNYFKKQLFISVYNNSPLILKEMKALFPDAYAYNQSLGIRLKFYNLRKWFFLSVAGLFAVFTGILIAVAPDELSIEINNYKYFLYTNQLYIFLILLALLLIGSVYMLFTIYRRKELFQRIRKKITRFEIKESLRLLAKIVRQEFPNRHVRNEIPLYLTLSMENTGATTMLKTLKMKRIADSPFEEFNSIKPACNWYVFDRGIFIDPAGKMDEKEGKLRMWKYFVRKLKMLRRLRPLDGIIVTVSFEDLMVSGSAQMNNLSRIKTKTNQLYAKLLYVQKKLRMQLPVYIVVTKCDKVSGFEEFIKKLPNEFDRNIFGWSSPYNTNVVSYTKNWILEAFQAINVRLTYLIFGLCIDDNNESDFDKIFNLRNEIDSVKYPMQILTNKIFGISENTLLAPLFLRGIYFTGSKSSHAEEIETHEKAFTYDLIDKKITREAPLGKPARKIIIY